MTVKLPRAIHELIEEHGDLHEIIEKIISDNTSDPKSTGEWLTTMIAKDVNEPERVLLEAIRQGYKIENEDEGVDNVNHPAHYESGRFECIDVMIETQGTDAVQGFCRCNAFKYLYRASRKNGVEDIKKAIWYLNKYIELEEQQNER